MLILLIPVVYAYELPFNLTDFANMYYSYAEVVDFFIFFVIFASISKLVFEKRFGEGPASKGLWIGIGFALSLALVLFEKTQGWSLINLFPAALVVLAVVALAGLYYILKKYKVDVFAIPYIILYLIVMIFFPKFLNNLPRIIVFFAFVLFLICVIAIPFILFKKRV